jgi:hypothetical protein
MVSSILQTSDTSGFLKLLEKEKNRERDINSDRKREKYIERQRREIEKRGKEERQRRETEKRDREKRQRRETEKRDRGER